MEVPENLKYSKDHEWLLVEDSKGTIGITDYAQSELGDIVYVDIDPNLSEIKQGEIFGTIEAVKTVSDLLAPCSGKVTEINAALSDNPELVNTEPFKGGWMVKIEITDPAELDNLLDSSAYKELIGQ